MSEANVTCLSCGYSGLINTYDACMSIYADCRCPNCGSTDNQHNCDYLSNLQTAWKKMKEEEAK